MWGLCQQRTWAIDVPVPINYHSSRSVWVDDK